MNVDSNKILGLEKTLRQPITELKPKIKAVFGDDPEINDKALLGGLCDYSFVIKTIKNAHMNLPSCCVFSSWKEIINHADRLKDLHHAL
jgi:hypothetical protein